MEESSGIKKFCSITQKEQEDIRQELRSLQWQCWEQDGVLHWLLQARFPSGYLQKIRLGINQD